MIPAPDDLSFMHKSAGWALARLGPSEAALFKAVRRRMFAQEPHAFRFAPEDEDALSVAASAQRLSQACVLVACVRRCVAGIGGFERLQGHKIDHKGLIFGMYVEPDHRGGDIADAIMSTLLEQAAQQVESVDLTVVGGNARAIRFYERWGFRVFAMEPDSIRLATGEYLDECWMRLRFRA